VADLLDGDQTIPVPRADSWIFWLREAGAVERAARIMEAFPAQWAAEQKTWGGGDYLEIRGEILGWRIDIEVPMEQAGTATGTRTITEYEPAPALAALLHQPEPDDITCSEEDDG
jgi:hypothetical protein